MSPTSPAWTPVAGGCDCRALRYRLLSQPLFVHCCHCTWCQRESGAAFALNALIEADRVELLHGEPLLVHTPSASGKGQVIARCPTCHLAVWSNYAGAGPLLRFIRVGSLDAPAQFAPDIHIFTASKLPWVVLPPAAISVPEFYEREKLWPQASLQRLKALMPQILQYRQQQGAS